MRTKREIKRLGEEEIEEREIEGERKRTVKIKQRTDERAMVRMTFWLLAFNKIVFLSVCLGTTGGAVRKRWFVGLLLERL